MSEQPPIQLRTDLQLTSQRRRWETTWILKDPVAFAHFIFSDQEHFILTLLDGQRTLPEVRQAWIARFRSESLSLEQLEAFCRRLAADGLMMSSVMGRGSALSARNKGTLRRAVNGVLRSPLAIRLPGVNPEGLLDLLAVPGRLLFHPFVIGLNLLLACAVLLFMLGNVEDLSAKLPTISRLLSSTGILWLMTALAFIKILHELGHAIACRVCGGECTEIGILLLAFTPCLYCNVSDAWLFPDKRRRILVSAAGIYVEIILSALFAIVWFWTEPGWVNAMAFNIVLICSINTLLLNGNPLLRYDGYYILSDLCDVPNLGQQSSRAIRSIAGSLVNRNVRSYGSTWLAVYGGLSLAYRCFIIFSILSGIYFVLKAYDLQLLAAIIAALTLTGIISTFWQQARYTMKQRQRLLNWNLPGILLLVFIVGGSLYLIFGMPLPAHVYAPAVVELRTPHFVYAPRAGELQTALALGSQVTTGQELIRLKDDELTIAIEQSQGRLDSTEEFLRQLKLRENSEPHLAVKIASVGAEVTELRGRLELLKKDQTKLTILSPADGHLIPAPTRPVLPEHVVQLATWSGTPLDAENQGCFVQRGELLAIVGDDQRRHVVVYVNEQELNDVAIGSPAQISFAQLPRTTFAGNVVDIVKEDVRVTPRELQGDTRVDSVRDTIGVSRPLETPYRVLVEPGQLPVLVRTGSTAQVRLRIANRTLASRAAALIVRLIKNEI